MRYAIITPLLLFLMYFCALSWWGTSQQNYTGDPQNLQQRQASRALWRPQARIDIAYPIEQIKQGVSGCVTYRYTINRQGHAEAITMLKGDEGFVAAGKQAIQAMRWQPTLANPARQPHTTVVQLDWRVSPVSKHFQRHCQ